MKLNYPKLLNWFVLEDCSKIFGYHEVSINNACSYFPIIRLALEQGVIVIWSSNDERYLLYEEHQNKDLKTWDEVIKKIERN